MIKTLFHIVVILCATALLVASYQVILMVGTLSIKGVLYSGFGVGLIGGALSTLLLVSPHGFIAVLKHELAHAMAAVITFNRPVGLHVNTDGSGLAEYQGRSNWFISLAPYFFPVLSVPLLLMGAFGIAGGYVFQILLGIAAGFDLVISIRQFGFHQPDLNYAGEMLSTCLILSVGILCWTWIALYGISLSLKQVSTLMSLVVQHVGQVVSQFIMS